MNKMRYRLFEDRKGTTNKTVAIFVIASLLISIIGTWTVLTQINKINTKMQTNKPHYDSGKVSMTLTPANQPTDTGKIMLEIRAE